MLELLEVSHSFKDVEVFKNVNFILPSNTITGLFGASGCGKSTFLYIASLMLKSDFGKIKINDEEIKTEKEIMNVRRKYFGFIFQFHNLIPEFTALENIQIACDIASKRDDEFIKFLLNEMGVYEKRNEKPATLSGGEAQRFGIARAFAKKPSIVFADEPTGNLDPETAERTINLITNLSKQHKASLLIVTHNYKFQNKFDDNFEIKNKTLEKIYAK